MRALEYPGCKWKNGTILTTGDKLDQWRVSLDIGAAKILLTYIFQMRKIVYRVDMRELENFNKSTLN